MYTIFDEIINTNSLENTYYITTQSTEIMQLQLHNHITFYAINIQKYIHNKTGII